MGLDLTAKNGQEGRIAVWAHEAFDTAVDEYWQGHDSPPCFDSWARGHDVDRETCERIADALSRAVNDDFFKSNSTLNAHALRLAEFLRQCDGEFEACG